MAPDAEPTGAVLRLHPPADGAVVAEVTGDLDVLVTPALTRDLVAAAGPDVPVLVVDLQGVTLLSAAAIAMLVDVARDAGARGSQVRMVAASRAVLRPLAVTGDDVHLPLFSSLPAALGARLRP